MLPIQICACVTESSIIYFLRLITQVGRTVLPESPVRGEGLRRPKAYAEGLQEGEVPREGGREGGDSRERCCQSPVRGEGLRRRPKACRRAKSRGREGIAGERDRERERERERKREEGGSQTGSQRVRKREVRRRRVYTLWLEARRHGQLYVALSRSRNQHNVKVRIQPNPLQGALLNDARQFTRNVVLHEVFQL